MATSEKVFLYSFGSSDATTRQLLPSNLYMYGPYTSMTAALSTLNAALDPDEFPIGFTFGVLINNRLHEYWLQKSLTSAMTSNDVEEKIYAVKTTTGFKIGDYTFTFNDNGQMTSPSVPGGGTDEPETPTTYTYSITATFSSSMFSSVQIANNVSSMTSGTAYPFTVSNNTTNYTVVANPKNGYIFTGWKEGSIIVSSDPAYTFALNKNYNLQATAEAMAISSNINQGSVSIADGAQIGTYTVTATPQTGYKFVRWSDGVTTPTRTMTVSNTKSQVTAIFEEDTVETIQFTYGTPSNNSVSIETSSPTGLTYTLSNNEEVNGFTYNNKEGVETNSDKSLYFEHITGNVSVNSSTGKITTTRALSKTVEVTASKSGLDSVANSVWIPAYAPFALNSTTCDVYEFTKANCLTYTSSSSKVRYYTSQIPVEVGDQVYVDISQDYSKATWNQFVFLEYSGVVANSSIQTSDTSYIMGEPSVNSVSGKSSILYTVQDSATQYLSINLNRSLTDADDSVKVVIYIQKKQSDDTVKFTLSSPSNNSVTINSATTGATYSISKAKDDIDDFNLYDPDTETTTDIFSTQFTLNNNTISTTSGKSAAVKVTGTKDSETTEKIAFMPAYSNPSLTNIAYQNTFTKSDLIAGCYDSGAVSSDRARTPLIPIQKGDELYVEFQSTKQEGSPAVGGATLVYFSEDATTQESNFSNMVTAYKLNNKTLMLGDIYGAYFIHCYKADGSVPEAGDIMYASGSSVPSIDNTAYVIIQPTKYYATSVGTGDSATYPLTNYVDDFQMKVTVRTSRTVEEPETPTLSIYPTSVTFEANDSSTKTVNVTSNTTWTIS